MLAGFEQEATSSSLQAIAFASSLSRGYRLQGSQRVQPSKAENRARTILPARTGSSQPLCLTSALQSLGTGERHASLMAQPGLSNASEDRAMMWTLVPKGPA